MRDKKRLVAAALIAGALLASTPPAGARAFAQISDDVVKLGVTNDQASIYSAAGGFGAVIATRIGVEDFGGTVLGKKIEVVFDRTTRRGRGPRDTGPLGSRLHAVRPIWPRIACSPRTTNPLQHC